MTFAPDLLKFILYTLLHFSWIFLFLIFLWGFHKAWMYYVCNRFWRAKDWVLLEIYLPQLVELTPKSTEQMLAGLHGVYKGPNLIEKYWHGYKQPRFSLEIAGINGEIHFFIRCERKFRRLVESQVYAQYPEAEIFESPDYTANVPFDLPNKDWDVWGTDLRLVSDEIYPIRTHPYFKEQEIEGGIIDPLASFSEIFSHLRQGEQVWVQILISPTHEPWQKKSEQERDKLIGKAPEKKSKTGFTQTGEILQEEGSGWGRAATEVLFGTKLGTAAETKQEERVLPSLMQHLAPGTQEKVKAIELKATKLGFTSKVRFVYLGTRDIFTKANVSAIAGAFKQFSTLDLNGFGNGPKTKTSVDYVREQGRLLYRKRKILMYYRYRTFDGDLPYIFNIEEIASLFHLPSFIVKTPMMPRVEAKKGEPPVGLPVG